MRRPLAALTAPGRWRGRRRARMALAVALVVAAPFVGRTDPSPPAGPLPADGPGSPASPGHAGATGPGAPGDRGPLRVVTVPLADPAVADVLRPGDLVDLVSTADTHAPAGPEVVARAASVRDTPAGRSGNRSLLVEVPESEASRLASTAAGTPLAVVVHG